MWNGKSYDTTTTYGDGGQDTLYFGPDIGVDDPISDVDSFFWLLAGLGALSAVVSLGIDTRQHT